MDNRLKLFSRRLGYMMSVVLILCATAIVVALTAKFIFWLF